MTLIEPLPILDRGAQASATDAFDSEQIRTKRLLHRLMRTVLVPENDLRRLPKYGVITMIGNSVHATPLLGAKGANFAISDAVELAEGIEGHGAEQEAAKRLYQERWEKWKFRG